MTGLPRPMILDLGRGPAAMDPPTEGTAGRHPAHIFGAKAFTDDASRRVNHAPDFRETLA